MSEDKDKAPERVWLNNPVTVTEHDQQWWYENPMAFLTIECLRADLVATKVIEARGKAFKDAISVVRSLLQAPAEEKTMWNEAVRPIIRALEIAALERAAESGEGGDDE